MKKITKNNPIKSNSPHSVCQIVDEAIEELRKKDGEFDIEHHISKYNLADNESREALVEELIDAIFLDDLFS